MKTAPVNQRWPKMLAGMVEPTTGELLIDDHPLEFGDYSFRSQRIRMIFFRIPRPRLTRVSVFRRSSISRCVSIPILNQKPGKSRLSRRCAWWACYRITSATIRICWRRGKKQRPGLARALILRPKVIICDEALASLDMSMRSQLINLMLELQEKNREYPTSMSPSIWG